MKQNSFDLERLIPSRNKKFNMQKLITEFQTKKEVCEKYNYKSKKIYQKLVKNGINLTEDERKGGLYQSKSGIVRVKRKIGKSERRVDYFSFDLTGDSFHIFKSNPLIEDYQNLQEHYKNKTYATRQKYLKFFPNQSLKQFKKENFEKDKHLNYLNNLRNIIQQKKGRLNLSFMNKKNRTFYRYKPLTKDEKIDLCYLRKENKEIKEKISGFIKNNSDVFHSEEKKSRQKLKRMTTFSERVTVVGASISNKLKELRMFHPLSQVIKTTDDIKGDTFDRNYSILKSMHKKKQPISIKKTFITQKKENDLEVIYKRSQNISSFRDEEFLGFLKDYFWCYKHLSPEQISKAYTNNQTSKAAIEYAQDIKWQLKKVNVFEEFNKLYLNLNNPAFQRPFLKLIDKIKKIDEKIEGIDKKYIKTMTRLNFEFNFGKE